MQTKGMHQGVLGKITTITFWDLWNPVEIRPQVIESNGHTWWGLTVFKILAISLQFGELQMWLDLLACCPKTYHKRICWAFFGHKSCWCLGFSWLMMLFMVQKSGIHQLRLVVYPFIYGILNASPVVVSRGMNHQRRIISQLTWSVVGHIHGTHRFEWNVEDLEACMKGRYLFSPWNIPEKKTHQDDSRLLPIPVYCYHFLGVFFWCFLFRKEDRSRSFAPGSYLSKMGVFHRSGDLVFRYQVISTICKATFGEDLRL